MNASTLQIVGREVRYDADLARRVVSRWLLNVSTVLAALMLMCSIATLIAVVRFELADYQVYAVRSAGDPYAVNGWDSAERARDAAAALSAPTTVNQK